MKPALLTSLPRFRWRPGERYALVPPSIRDAAPALAEDLDVLAREVLPDFYDFDEAALRAQNAFRLGQVTVIVGGATATALGAVQAALGGGVAEVAIAEALVAGALTGAVAYVRGRNVQREYLTNRLKAERLRSEYFVFLGQIAPYDASDAEQRRARLRERVGQIASESTP